MSQSVFVELRFWLLVVLSFAAPVAMYRVLIHRRSIVRSAVFVLGISLVLISAVDVYLLQTLATHARLTASTVDNALFDSELSVALYAFPLFFGGLGMNVVSHLVIDHLLRAERRYDREHRQAPAADEMTMKGIDRPVS